jgi:hypothetical protein
MPPILVPGPGNSRISSAVPPHYSRSPTHYPLFLHTTAPATLLFSSTSFTVPITPRGGGYTPDREAHGRRSSSLSRLFSRHSSLATRHFLHRHSLPQLPVESIVYFTTRCIPRGWGDTTPNAVAKRAGEDPAHSPFLSPLVPGPGSSRTTRHFRPPPPQPACISNIQWILVRKPDVYSLYG